MSAGGITYTAARTAKRLAPGFGFLIGAIISLGLWRAAFWVGGL